MSLVVESPIEDELSLHLYANDVDRLHWVKTFKQFMTEVEARPGRIVAASQVWLGDARVDFLVGMRSRMRPPYVVVVECDGAA